MFNNILKIFVCLLFVVGFSSCASVDEKIQEKNAQIMNIWVAPEYARVSQLSDENYIAVFINSSTLILDNGNI